MPDTLDEITGLLADIDSTGSFATHFTVPADDLRLEVKDVGRIRLPVATTTARELCAVARPARHGFKDQTLLDRKVRDTWEIPKSRITIDQRAWKKTLAPALDRIRRDLGLSPDCRLEARLHNLLVYAPGQFFATHQDSEKAEAMVATLVVSLPSRFTGGNFVIEHHDERRRVGGSDQHLTLIAFYADCPHEVRPIEQGYRVVLTYELIAQGDAAVTLSSPARLAILSMLVRRFFDTPMPAGWPGERKAEPPDRLVYLLDHEYTQHGLAWARLKNADAARAAALREVARRLDCEVFLALADVHETWSCEDDYFGYDGGGGRGRGRGRWSYDEDDDDAFDEDDQDGGSGDHELIELIDSEVELRHWVAPDGRTPQAISHFVSDRELCYTKPSVDCEPFRSEHEGYTGNAGNTVDHWYHRAAVVLWPRERTFVIRARASSRWAVDEIARTLTAGDRMQALEQARRVLPFWPGAMPDRRSDLLRRTLRLAAGLDDAELAAGLLAPFRLIDLKLTAVTHLVALLERHGSGWCEALLRQWTQEKTGFERSDEVLAWLRLALPAVCRALCAGKIAQGPAVAGRLLEIRCDWMHRYLEPFRKAARTGAIEATLSRLGEPMRALIESCTIANRLDLRDRMIDGLMADRDALPVQVPLALLRAADRAHAGALDDLGLRRLHAHLAKLLAARLAVPARAEDDWSIRTAPGCSCVLCAELSQFLRSPEQVRYEWPLASDKRSHVHHIIDSHVLPVRHQTRRTGRPYTLVLEKTSALFEREAAERRFWAKELGWLEKVGDATKRGRS